MDSSIESMRSLDDDGEGSSKGLGLNVQLLCGFIILPVLLMSFGSDFDFSQKMFADFDARMVLLEQMQQLIILMKYLMFFLLKNK